VFECQLLFRLQRLQALYDTVHGGDAIAMSCLAGRNSRRKDEPISVIITAAAYNSVHCMARWRPAGDGLRAAWTINLVRRGTWPARRPAGGCVVPQVEDDDDINWYCRVESTSGSKDVINYVDVFVSICQRTWCDHGDHFFACKSYKSCKYMVQLYRTHTHTHCKT